MQSYRVPRAAELTQPVNALGNDSPGGSWGEGAGNVDRPLGHPKRKHLWRPSCACAWRVGLEKGLWEGGAVVAVFPSHILCDYLPNS